MDTNTQNEMSMDSTASGPTSNVEDTMTSETTEMTEASSEQATESTEAAGLDANQPHHHNNSAIRAASMGHSAVHHVMPHHRKLDI